MHPVKILIPFLLLSVIAVWMTTSGPSPFEIDITRQAQEQLTREYADLGPVAAVEFVSGRALKDRYEGAFRFELSFSKAFAEVAAARRQEAAVSPQMFARTRVDKELEALRTDFGDFKAGDVLTETAQLTFAKTADGWRIQ
jgi:hypothetical protein